MKASAGDDRHAQDKEDVAQDRPGDARLDEVGFTLVQGEEGDDHFGGVAEGCVEQPADAGPHRLGEAFRRPSHEARERELLQRQLDVATELGPDGQYPYARAGIVVPGIAGSIRKSLQRAAVDLGPPGPDCETGYGCIQLP